MSGAISIYADRRFVKVKGFSTAPRPKATSVKVEFEVTNSWALEDLLRSLHVAQHPNQDEMP